MTTAGIDVSKAHLDLALLGPSYQRNLRFPNTPEGQEALLAALRLHHPLRWSQPAPITSPSSSSCRPLTSPWAWSAQPRPRPSG